MVFNAEDAENVEKMTQKDLAAFSRNMKKIRAELKISQVNMAKEAGVCKATWCLLERGRTENVKFQALEMIAYTLGMTVVEMLTEGEEE